MVRPSAVVLIVAKRSARVAAAFLVFACAAAVFVLSGCAGEPLPPVPPPGRDIVLPRETETIEAVVPRNGTLDSILRDHDLPMGVVHAVVESARSVFNPRQIRAHQPYRLVRSVDGWLREFEYEIDVDRFLRIVSPNRLTPEVLEASVLPFEKHTEIIAIRGEIDGDHSSLIAAMAEAGEKVELAISLAELFGGEIDFQSDLQPGDSFELLFEKSSREAQFAGYGPILAARFQNEGREYQAIRWVNPSTSKAGFYDEKGRSLKRTILKSPLKFEPRVTSGFSRRRLHPVHHVVRAHLGVDYAAPQGAARGGCGRRSGLCWLGWWRRQTDPLASQRRTRELLSAPLILWPGRSPRRARRAGTDDRPRRVDRYGHWSAPRLPDPPERDVRRSAARTCEAAARRADSGWISRGIPDRA